MKIENIEKAISIYERKRHDCFICMFDFIESLCDDDLNEVDVLIAVDNIKYFFRQARKYQKFIDLQKKCYHV